jgi:hypothetical protein
MVLALVNEAVKKSIIFVDLFNILRLIKINHISSNEYKIKTLNFFQFLFGNMVDFGGYMGQTFGPIEGGSIGLSIGRTYGSMGWASYLCLLCGIIADKYFSAQKF